jgi:hypothetical protein
MKPDGQSGPQLATYARYNVLLEPGWLKTTVKLDLAPEARRSRRWMTPTI